jgi:rhamnogalacturonyl hydrolase YesR
MATSYGLHLGAMQEAELGKNEASWVATRPKWGRICGDVLASARRQGYGGYSKFDALNSPLLHTLSFDNKWLRFVYTQAVNRCPFHIRPILGVRRSRNPKGIALFVRAYLFLYAVSGNERYKGEAEKLLQWLMDHKAEGSKHASWGYNFVWQNTIFLQGRNEPNCVVSVFVGEALVHAYRVLGKEDYLAVASDVADFILKELPVLSQGRDEMAIGYVLQKPSSIVLNINILAGAFLVKLWKHTSEADLLRAAQKLLNFTARRRTSYDAWYYTYPRHHSPITHDNYHTGGIVDGLLEYFEETGDDRYLDVYRKGLEYYQKHLFEPDGAPRWMSNKKYPLDVHGAAQGIISFSKAARHNEAFGHQAEKIAEWTLQNFYRPRTRDFAYRKGRYVTWNYSLMRWCNAWMARALGEMVSQ